VRGALEGREGMMGLVEAEEDVIGSPSAVKREEM
jgi:hypothetical protein